MQGQPWSSAETSSGTPRSFLPRTAMKGQREIFFWREKIGPLPTTSWIAVKIRCRSVVDLTGTPARARKYRRTLVAQTAPQ